MSRETLEYWQRQMRAAPSEAQLLAIVGEYLATLSHEQVHQLPRTSRPVPIAHRDDVASLTVQIARDELMYEGDAHTASLLRQMVVVLNEANNRIAQLSMEAQYLGPPST